MTATTVGPDSAPVSGRAHRRGIPAPNPLKVSGGAICAVLVIFMMAPAITIVVLSFAGGQELVFPPQSWGFIEYHRLFTNGVWVPAIEESLLIGVPVSLLAIGIGFPAALAINRTNLPRKGFIRAFGVAPLVVPAVAYAVALYDFLSQVGLLGSYWGLVLSDTMLVTPFVIIVIEAALIRIPRELELVAMTLGASRRRALLGITVRLALPAIIAAWVLAFATNFDESVFVNFLSGTGLTTLPKAVFDSLRTGLTPSIAAVAAFLMVLSTAVVAVAMWLSRARLSG